MAPNYSYWEETWKAQYGAETQDSKAVEFRTGTLDENRYFGCSRSTYKVPRSGENNLELVTVISKQLHHRKAIADADLL